MSYQSLKPHLTNLRFCGFYPLSKDSIKSHQTLHRVYMRSIFSLFLFYTIQQIIKVYQVRGDADKIIDIMFLLLTNSDCLYKQIVLWIKADKIEELLAVMKGPMFNPSLPRHQNLLLKTALQARILLRIFNIVALATCLLWVLYPVILYSQGKPVEFSIWLPFNANISPQFYVAALYVWIQTSWLAYCNTTIDAFVSFFFAQCKTQLTILRFNLENVITKCKRDGAKFKMPLEIIFDSHMRKILFHYEEILLFSNKIQNIFGGALLYQFLVSGWIICTTAYRTVNIHPASVEFVSMIMYMCCILTEIFLFCFFANEVTHESERLKESAYAMNWLDIPLKHRRTLIIFMERIKRPIGPIAGAIIPLSNRTFVSVVRSSYTFYTFLKNTGK